MNILEIARHAIADVTVHRDRRACDYKFQTLSTTPSLIHIHCSILSLSCRILLINQSVKPVWFLENSGSPASLPHNTFKMHCVIWHDQWENPNSMGRHEPPNLINLSLFLCRVSIQSVKQCAWLHVFLTDVHMDCHVIGVIRLCFCVVPPVGWRVCLLPGDGCFHQKKPTAPTKPRETTWLTLPLHQQPLLVL